MSTGAGPLSAPLNEKLADARLLSTAGPESIAVSGGTATVHTWRSAAASTFPSGSVARTSNARSPSARFAYSTGDVQDAHGSPSSAHSNVASGSSAAKVSEASALVVGDAGPVSVVLGGIAIAHAW